MLSAQQHHLTHRTLPSGKRQISICVYYKNENTMSSTLKSAKNCSCFAKQMVTIFCETIDGSKHFPVAVVRCLSVPLCPHFF